MRNCKTVPRNFLISFSAVACVACGNASPDAIYGPADCRRIELTDSQTGAVIVGAEDLALDAGRGRIIISAYDRRAAEKAAKAGKAPPPQGGVYAAAIDDLFGAQPALAVAPIIDAKAFDDGLRPHGVGFGQGEIVFINRGYEKTKNRWRMQAALVRVDAEGAITKRPVHCAANDAAIIAGENLYTRDHAACGGLARVYENIFARKTSGAYFEAGGALIDGVAFANGVAAAEAGFAVAATREKAIHIFNKDDAGRAQHNVASVPGGPDNVSFTADGEIIAAVHPNLLRLAFNRKLGLGKAGSRIVRIDALTRDAELLFDDPAGELFSAATIGVMTERGLVAGSVTDAGVLVCESKV